MACLSSAQLTFCSRWKTKPKNWALRLYEIFPLKNDLQHANLCPVMWVFISWSPIFMMHPDRCCIIDRSTTLQVVMEPTKFTSNMLRMSSVFDLIRSLSWFIPAALIRTLMGPMAELIVCTAETTAASSRTSHCRPVTWELWARPEKADINCH